MKRDIEWLRTGSEDLIALVKEKGKGELYDPESGARYPRKALMDIYGFLIKRCIEEPWDEDLYGVLKMVGGILDLPEEAQRRIHSEAMLNPFMIGEENIDRTMMKELEKVYLVTLPPEADRRPEGPGYGINARVGSGSSEDLQTVETLMMEVEKGSLIAGMLEGTFGPSSRDSAFSLDTDDRKRSNVLVKDQSKR